MKTFVPDNPDGDTEQRILDAAHAVFVRRGTAGARMQEIAEEAGVNKALLHYYFRSKERLAEATFLRAARGLLPPVLQLLASDASIEDKVRGVVRLEHERLSQAPYLPGYILSELRHNPDRALQLVTALGVQPDQVREHVLGTLRRQIDEGVRAGTLRPIEAEEFAVNLISLCVFPFAAKPMLMMLMGTDNAGFEDFIERRTETLTSFFLEAIRP
jgi:TetR/AcrR family transcriptional regulator